MPREFNIVPLDLSDPTHKVAFDWVLGLEKEEGWEILPADIKSLTSSKQTSIYLLFVEEKCIGSISLFADPRNKYMAIGAFIIDPAYRNRGLGTKILAHCLTVSGATLAGLLSAPERVDFYRRLGFSETGSAVSASSLEVPKPTIEMDQFKLSELSEADTKRIIEYDSKVTGLFRGHLLCCMLENSTVAVGSFDGVRARGYALARPFSSTTGNGFRIALYADDSSIFAELLGKILNHLQAITDTLSIRVTSPVYKGKHLESQGFKYEGGPFPFLTTASNSTKLLGDNTYGILLEEFC